MVITAEQSNYTTFLCNHCVKKGMCIWYIIISRIVLGSAHHTLNFENWKTCNNISEKCIK